MLIRWAALSLGPRMVIYGLTAVCNMANPVPKENKPTKNIPYVLVRAAGTNIKAPIAMIQNAIIIPFLKPADFNR
jgi:hypothetical protein